MPSFGDFGDAQIEVYGEWISDTLQSSLTRIPSGTEDRWGFLEWEEENTDDETEAYIRIDILKASDSSVLASDLSSNITVPFKKGKIDLTN
ncbi:hypothetical protein HYU06_05895, partial [Candidatus Woesearchaeota archaeon]|nr:hypothetical protein [Candidatus Woesearchaeota archaeon]